MTEAVVVSPRVVSLPALQQLARDFPTVPLVCYTAFRPDDGELDRKSTRLNSSHVEISYAVFCLKKKNESDKNDTPTISMSLSHCIHQTLNSKASTRFHSGGLQQS